MGEGWGEGQATTPSTRFTGLDPVPTVGSGARLPPTRHPQTNPSLLPKRNVGALGRGRPWGETGAAKTTLPSHPIVTPTCHPAPPHLSSRTLLLSSRAKPRDLKQPPTTTPLFKNPPDHRRAGDTRYPRGAGGARVRSIRAMPHCQAHTASLPRLAGLRSGTHPFVVFPDSDRGPRGAATSTRTTHPQPPVPPPPSCRGNPVPTGRGRGPGTLDSRNAPPPPSFVLPDSDPVPTPLSSSPTPIGDPGARLPPTHPRPIHNPPYHHHRRAGETRYPRWGAGGAIPKPRTRKTARRTPPHLPRLAGLRSGTHLFIVFPDSDRGPTARRRGKSQYHPSLAPHRHPNLSSRTLLLSSRAKPRDLKRSSTPTPLFTNIPDHRRAGETRYPPLFRLPRLRSATQGRGYLPHTHDPSTTPRTTTTVVPGKPGTHGARAGPGYARFAQCPTASLLRLTGLRSGTHPFIVFPDSDRGPRGAATSHTPTTHSQPPSTHPSIRRTGDTRYPRWGAGERGGFTVHPNPPMPSRALQLSSRAKPRDLRPPPPATALFTNTPAHPNRLVGLRSGTHPFFVFPDSDRGPTRTTPHPPPPC